MNKDQEKMLYNLNYIQELIRSSFSDAKEAYEVIEKYEDENKYNMALNYLILANQSFVELKRFLLENELEHNEITPFIDGYEHFKFQLKEVITDKDKNTSWLYSANTQLLDKWKYTDEFLNNSIKSIKDYN